MLTLLNLCSLAQTSGDIIVNATNMSTMDLRTLASSMKSGKLIIKNAEVLDPLDANSIALANPGKVTFDFTNL